MGTKPFWQSWTFVFNILIAIYEVLVNFHAFDGLDPQVVATITLIGNLLLRFKTRQGISLSLK